VSYRKRNGKKTVLIGAQRSLECGYAIEGLKSLYEAIWRNAQATGLGNPLHPSDIKTSKVVSDLGKLSEDYLARIKGRKSCVQRASPAGSVI